MEIEDKRGHHPTMMTAMIKTMRVFLNKLLREMLL
jgi:hypothetical protein